MSDNLIAPLGLALVLFVGIPLIKKMYNLHIKGTEIQDDEYFRDTPKFHQAMHATIFVIVVIAMLYGIWLDWFPVKFSAK